MSTARDATADDELHPELRGCLEELEAQTAAVRALLESLDDLRLDWRPESGKWSIGEHVAHLVVTNRLYLPSLDEAVRRGREEGRTGRGPYRHPLLARLFAWSMKPPPRFRVKTFNRLVPAERHHPEELLREFIEVQERLGERIRAADGVDLGAVRFPSPIAGWLRLSLGTALRALVAHNQRHLWHVQRVLDTEGFPSAAGPS